MARQFRKIKPLIYVFCEGESEQAYADFLKNQFADIAVIKRPKETGVFETASGKFSNSPSYKNNAEVTDEIWFFFDVEKDEVSKWGERCRIMKSLERLRERPNIRVRLLMTTACIEYWFMLHFKMYAPQLESAADKKRVFDELVKNEPTYKKGDMQATQRIAEKYPVAVKNAAKTVENLLQDGLPGVEDTEERNRWLYTSSKTFSTVYEAILYLENL